MIMNRINKLALWSVLNTLLVMSGMVQLAQAQVSGVAPQTFWRETDQTLPAGLWRIQVNGDTFSIQKNTDATGAFGTVGSALSFDSARNASFTGFVHVAPTLAAGTYGMVVLGATGTARDLFLVGESGYSNGMTVQYTGSAMRYVFNDGFVGVGVGVPQSPLHVTSDGGVVAYADQLRIDSGVNAHQAGIHFTDNVTSDAGITFTPNATVASRKLTLSADFVTDQVTIRGDGKVGIGGAPVTYPLEVFGVNGLGIEYKDTTNGVNGFLGAFNSKLLLGTISNHDVSLYTNNAEKARITTGGQVLYTDGTIAAPSHSFISAAGTGFSRNSSGYISVDIAGNEVIALQSTGVGLASTGSFSWNGDTYLTRDAANVLAMKNSTTAQELRVYGSTTGPKYIGLRHSGSTAFLGTSDNSAIVFQIEGNNKWVIGELSENYVFRPNGDNAVDIGLAGVRVRSGYFGTSLNVGPANNSTITSNVGVSAYYGATNATTATAGTFVAVGNNTSGTELDFFKTRNTTTTAGVGVSNADVIMSLASWADTGNAYLNTARYQVVVDGTYTANQRPPTRAEIWTNAANAVPVRRFILDSAGLLNVSSFLSDGYIAVGTTPATTGNIRIDSGTGLYSRNVANSANIQLIGTTSVNTVINSEATIVMKGSATTQLNWDGSALYMTNRPGGNQDLGASFSYWSRGYVATLYLDNTVVLAHNNSSFANGAGSGSGTLTNAPSAGNPTKWIAIDDGGTTRYIPAW